MSFLDRCHESEHRVRRRLLRVNRGRAPDRAWRLQRCSEVLVGAIFALIAVTSLQLFPQIPLQIPYGPEGQFG